MIMLMYVVLYIFTLQVNLFFLNINVTLQNSIEENAFNILLRVHLIHLKDLAINFLFPLFFEKGMLPSDTIIR